MLFPIKIEYSQAYGNDNIDYNIPGFCKINRFGLVGNILWYLHKYLDAHLFSDYLRFHQFTGKWIWFEFTFLLRMFKALHCRDRKSQLLPDKNQLWLPT
jgi:hypothetical protein